MLVRMLYMCYIPKSMVIYLFIFAIVILFSGAHCNTLVIIYSVGQGLATNQFIVSLLQHTMLQLIRSSTCII